MFPAGKNKRFCISAVLLLFFYALNAQANLQDSLLGLLKKSLPDTQRLTSLSMLADSYTNSDLSLAEKYLEEARPLEKKLGYDHGSMLYFMCAGNIKVREGGYDSALYFFEKMISYAVKTNDRRMMASGLQYKGETSFYQGKFSEAKKYYQESIPVYMEFPDEKDNIFYAMASLGAIQVEEGEFAKGSKTLERALLWADSAKVKKHRGSAYNNLGVAFEKMGRYDACVKNYFVALRFYEANNNKVGVVSTTANIGIIFKKQGKMKEAFDNFTKALDLAKKYKLNEDVAQAQYNLGLYYQDIKDFKTSVEYLEKSEAFYRTSGNKYDLGDVTTSLSWSYAETGKLEKAFRYINEAIAIFKEVENADGVSKAYEYIAFFYKVKGDFKNAEDYTMKALEISRREKLPEHIADDLQLLYELKKEKGDFKNALTALEELIKVKDSILNRQNNLVTSELSTLYETEQKQNEIGILNRDKKIQENEIKKRQLIIYSVSGAGILLIILSLLIIRSNRQKQVANRIITLQKEEVEMQKKLVEDQKAEVDHAYEKLHEKNKEVMDSIHYARRIQRALITSEKYIERVLTALQKKG